ncbi:hypothetical protein [[Eubacterium] cellulosolvens]
MSINDFETDYESRMIRVRVLRETPELFFSGRTFGPFKDGDEIEIPRWLARELTKNRMVKILDEGPLEIPDLAKIHWRESIPESREIPQLDYDFYNKLRELLRELSNNDQDPSQKALFEKALSQSKDIINCRLHKIVYLAASPSTSDATIQKMAVEERSLYNDLSSTINEWKNKILNLEVEE